MHSWISVPICDSATNGSSVTHCGAYRNRFWWKDQNRLPPLISGSEIMPAERIHLPCACCDIGTTSVVHSRGIGIAMLPGETLVYRTRQRIHEKSRVLHLTALDIELWMLCR